MGANHTSLKTFWETQVNTAYTAGTISEPDKYEALILLDRWINAEIAKDNFSATDIASYSITNRSVTRQSYVSVSRAASEARQAFMTKLYGDCVYADFRAAEGAYDL